MSTIAISDLNEMKANKNELFDVIQYIVLNDYLIKDFMNVEKLMSFTLS